MKRPANWQGLAIENGCVVGDLLGRDTGLFLTCQARARGSGHRVGLRLLTANKGF
jgi:hypothetical protein